MKAPSFLFLCLVASGLFLPCHSEDCNTNPPTDDVDCSTLRVSECLVYSSPGADGTITGELPRFEKNSRICLQTCYDNNEMCRATVDPGQNQNEIKIDAGASSDSYTLQRILSPNYDGVYLGSSICRFDITCHPPRILHYSYIAHTLEDEEMCDGSPMCVDYIELNFPTYGGQNEKTCGTLNTLRTLMGFDGMTELNAQIVTNRKTEGPGVSLNVYCVDPSFHQNDIDIGRKKRDVGERSNCTSPNGRGPRDEPPFPPQARRIQEVLAEENASYIVLNVTESLSYCNNNLTLSNGATYFVTSLLVENRFGVNVFFRVAPGQYSGFAQLAVSEQKAVMVQFGVRPIFVPTEEEASFISALEIGIEEALGDSGSYTLQNTLNELDALGRTEFDELEFKRGIESNFLDEVALEFGNACNGALRATACAYQEIVMGLDCLTGESI